MKTEKKKQKRFYKNNKIIKVYILYANKLNLHCDGFHAVVLLSFSAFLSYTLLCEYATFEIVQRHAVQQLLTVFSVYMRCAFLSVFLQFRFKCFISNALHFSSPLSIICTAPAKYSYDREEIQSATLAVSDNNVCRERERFVHAFSLTIAMPASPSLCC